MPCAPSSSADLNKPVKADWFSEENPDILCTRDLDLTSSPETQNLALIMLKFLNEKK